MTYQFKSEVTAGDFWKLTMSRTYRSVAGSLQHGLYGGDDFIYSKIFPYLRGSDADADALWMSAVSGDPADRDLSESQRAGKNDAERCKTFL